MALTLRFSGESDSEFRTRARRAARIARVLVEACIRNECVQTYLADVELPFFTEPSIRQAPIVRIEYEQAIANGDIGSTLAATRSKHWGPGPQILPLKPGDWFYPTRVTYEYRPSSLYNQRFEQRMRLKELLGKRWRRLVGEGKFHTKKIFLEHLTERQAQAIRNCIGVEPGEFWRACQGKSMLALPGRERQRSFPFEDEE